MHPGLLVVLVIGALWTLCSLALAFSLRHEHPRPMRARVRRVNSAGRSLFG